MVWHSGGVGKTRGRSAVRAIEGRRRIILIVLAAAAMAITPWALKRSRWPWRLHR
jgi:hypothetical protein